MKLKKAIHTMRKMTREELQHCGELQMIQVMNIKMPRIQVLLMGTFIQLPLMKLIYAMTNIALYDEAKLLRSPAISIYFNELLNHFLMDIVRGQRRHWSLFSVRRFEPAREILATDLRAPARDQRRIVAVSTPLPKFVSAPSPAVFGFAAFCAPVIAHIQSRSSIQILLGGAQAIAQRRPSLSALTTRLGSLTPLTWHSAKGALGVSAAGQVARAGLALQSGSSRLRQAVSEVAGSIAHEWSRPADHSLSILSG
jgi:hypothetical protein